MATTSTSRLQLSRQDIKRRITVEISVRGGDIASFVELAKMAIGSKVHGRTG